MANLARFPWPISHGPLAVVLLLSLLHYDGRAATPEDTVAAEYVRLALAHEAHGRQDFRQQLLEAALHVSPDYAPANWHLGHVQVDGKWVPINRAQELAAGDEALARYAQLRDKALGDPRRELALARLAQKEKWEDRAELHFASLALNPAAPPRIRDEAARRLDLVNVNGALLTEEEAKQAREVAERVESAIKTWQGRLEKWRQQIEVVSGRERQNALTEMAAIDDPDIIPVTETFLRDSGALFGEQLIRVLEKFPEHDATRTLARFAVLSPWENVRNLAIDELKDRPMHEYVPLLLDGLVAPIRSQFQIVRSPLGVVHYKHVFAQRNAEGNYVSTKEHVSSPVTFPEPERRLGRSADRRDAWLELQEKARLNALRAAVAALEHERALAQSNTAVSAKNEPIFVALENTTGELIGRDPADWQAWWQSYNEVLTEKRTYYEYQPTISVYVSFFDTYQGSCFAAGTPVWTESGVVPLETVKPGDRVLSQDLNTGELAYKVVLQTTALPPTSATVRVSLGDDSILMTRAHVVWVNNQGWKMAKELQPGDRLHGFDGIREVQGVEYLPPELEVYNLVVDDFNTFFVGKAPVLVHDITYMRFRRPTTVSVPGLAWK